MVGSQSISGATASTRLNGAPTSIRQFQITRKQQYDLFIITYQKLEDDVKRICQKTATIQAYHPDKSVTSDQAWDDIPQKIKEILVDLRYRGDYTPTIRSHLQHAAYAGGLSTFGSVLSNSSLWGNVPNDRFQRRVHYYEHN
ncbi:hypothetical protein [Rahnella bonaserana]|jgi:hypothetical protein|uniref:hypothetical protein n=1 Tax=Rahnella bonaserana TaxID=2816248 RepID=UPI0024C3B777|nr:hypothetical protein [Rahnella bonaserana]MCL9644013.1 hypothetical protein [Rahnella victoriana]WHZ42583.1 hypothetical protein QNM34_10090 [Rahnella bonaserana]